MRTISLEIDTPAWAIPLLEPKRFKAAKGGRASGKSHFFAELAVEEMVADPDLRFVCIREVQRSLKFSAKALIEAKIRKLGVSSLFVILEREIRRVGGTGVIIFEGMQDHTADSIKSLEAFGRAWVEEAHSLSARSLKLLIPTIRADNSEIWFSWNPESPDAAVEKFFQDLASDSYPLTSGTASGAHWSLVHVNYRENPFVPSVSKQDAARDYASDPDAYEHVWLGAYDRKSHAQILRGKWVVDEFEPGEGWGGPYHGLDFGFGSDPLAMTQSWTHDGNLYIRREAWRIQLELDDTAEYCERHVPDCGKYVIRADNSRPESISYLKRHGMPLIVGAPKWPGSVEDGIAHLRQYGKIIVHPECEHTQDEFRLYKYKVDKETGDPLPDIVDKHNHIPDSLRYALAPLIKQRRRPERRMLPGTRTRSNV